MRSGIDDVPGVGKKTRVALLKNLGSLKAIVAASEEALIHAGASASQAKAIQLHFAEAAQSSSTDPAGSAWNSAEESEDELAMLEALSLDDDTGIEMDPLDADDASPASATKPLD